MTIAAPGISYELIGTLSAAELTELAVEQFPLFDFPIPQKLTPPELQRGAKIYRAIYTIEVERPGLPSQQVVSGLVAIPDDEPGSTPRTLPLAIYNHGTLFDRDEVPSRVVFKENGSETWQVGSGETFLNLIQLINQGYALIAPDYLGLGINKIKEPYTVKDATNLSTLGILEASRSIFADLGIQPSQLFVNGWSQGSLNSQWMTQKLETLSIPVAATALESPVNDWLGSFIWGGEQVMKPTGDPSAPVDPGNPAPWLPLAMSQAIAAYEYWYQLDGLLEVMIKDKVIPDRQTDASGNIIDDPSSYTYNNNPDRLTYQDVTRGFSIDYNSIAFPPNQPFSNLSWSVRVDDGVDAMGQPQYRWTTIPGFTGKEMLIDGIFDAPQNDLVSDFLRQLQTNSPRFWKYDTPVRAWYGLSDEALPEDFVNPDMAIFGGSKVSLVPVEGASHRQTFLNALFATEQNPGGTSENLLDWFAGFLDPQAPAPQLVLSGNDLTVESESFGLMPVLLEVREQQGERPMHVQIRRIRQDGESEVIGSTGGTTANDQQLQSLGDGRLLLQVGERLAFDLLARDGGGIEASQTEIRANPGGNGYSVVVRTDAGLQPASLELKLMAAPEAFSPSILDRVAAPQSNASDALLQLKQGQLLTLQVSTDCAFENRLGFVRLNLDPITGLPTDTVGDQEVTIGSAEFRARIESLLEPGFQHLQSGRRVEKDLVWSVQQDGVYAPVLITPQGNVFSVGDSGAGNGGGQQLRLLGRNHFGFEDLTGSQSDWDWNDVAFIVTGISESTDQGLS